MYSPIESGKSKRRNYTYMYNVTWEIFALENSFITSMVQAMRMHIFSCGCGVNRDRLLKPCSGTVL
jgi:hypothetical protein